MTTIIEQLLAQDGAERATLLQTYSALCHARDEVNARVAPLQAELDAACARTQAAQAEELRIAAQIEAEWGPHWPALKKRIGELARTLVKVPPRG